ncbi:hypothetical protein SAMN05216281_101314 [Cryobacterium luteum]|nr:hypothetical protein SAMN05216281_101314 [Cryobacterium luteum]
MLALPLLVLASLTACAPAHATVDDCVTYMITELTMRGVDVAPVLESGDVLDKCLENLESMSQDEFDRIFLPE